MSERISTPAWSILQGRAFFPITGKTKKAVIADFVWGNDKYLYENDIRKPDGPNGQLSWRQKDAWAECEARGCRAVRVRIVQEPQP